MTTAAAAASYLIVGAFGSYSYHLLLLLLLPDQFLAKRLEQEQDLKVMTVGPMEPNLPGFIFSVISTENINDINNNLAALRKAGKNRVRTYCLISQHSTIKQKGDRSMFIQK